MEPDLFIGVIGEFNPEFPPHPATNAAIEHSAARLGARAAVRWLDTTSLEDCDAAELAGFDALWCAPGSPYRSLEGAVRAIQLGREAGLPFLGNVATLFVPQLNSSPEHPHPLIAAYLQAAAQGADRESQPEISGGGGSDPSGG